MTNTTNTYIIDFEFTGIDKEEIRDNEIISMSYFGVDTGVKGNIIFSSEKKNGIGSYLINKITPDMQEGKEKFSEEIFKNIFGENYEENNYVGFGISSDKNMIGKYGIYVNNYRDIQEDMMLLPDYEYTMATEGCSLECCYYMATGEEFKGSHTGTDEVEALYTMLQIVETKKESMNEYLEYYPWGNFAGIQLEEFVQDYRRNADGYRYNNSDILSESLDYYISIQESSWDDDEDIDF